MEEGDKVDDVKNYFLTNVLQYSYKNILEDKKRLESATFIAKNIPEDKVKELREAIRTVTIEATEELEKLKTSDDVFEMENKDHRFVHNPKRKTLPEGEEIIFGKVGSGKTYYTESQIQY